MDAPMKRYMRPGIISFKLFPIEQGTGPILESLLALCEDTFFSAIEVGWMKDLVVRDQARVLLDQSHVEVCYATQPAMFSQKLNPNSFDPEARRRAVHQVKNCIREATSGGSSGCSWTWDSSIPRTDPCAALRYGRSWPGSDPS